MGEESVNNKKRMNSSMLDEINEISNQLETYKLKKVMSSNEEHIDHLKSSMNFGNRATEEKDHSSQFQ